MSLPLREGSVIEQALRSASFNLRSNLESEVYTAVNAVKENSAQMYHGRTGFDADLKKCRANAEAVWAKLEAAVVQNRQRVQKALEAYDQDVRELEAWLAASDASARFGKAVRR